MSTDAMPPSAPQAVSVVIPLFNERDSIAATLEQLFRAMEQRGGAFEVLVVDDGSTDGSAQGLGPLGERVRLLRHERNRGYGAALKTGFAAARHELLAFLDADGSYPPGDLPALLEQSAEAEMVVGRRQGYAAHASLGRRFAKAAVLVPLARYLTETDIPDINSGMRVVRRHLVERYWSLLPDGFSLTTTLTLALLSAGHRVVYHPIDYRPRGGRSKIRPLRDFRNFVLLILRTVTYFHPLKVYVPVSALLVLASIVVVLVTKYLFGRLMDLTALFLFIAGLQMLLIGVVADLVLKLLGTRK